MPRLNLARLITGLDITEMFKTKGDTKRWSAKRTIGGIIAVTACADITENGMTWMAVAMCGIAIIPISLSFFERD